MGKDGNSRGVIKFELDANGVINTELLLGNIWTVGLNSGFEIVTIW
jgi:hypothetical protein